MDATKQDLINYIRLTIKLKGDFAQKLHEVLRSYEGFKLKVASQYEAVFANDILERKRVQFKKDVRVLFYEWFETEEKLKEEYDDMITRHLKANEDWKGKNHIVHQKYLALVKEILAEKADFRKALEQIAAQINETAKEFKQKGKDLQVPDLDKSEGFLSLLENVTPNMLMINLVQGNSVLI